MYNEKMNFYLIKIGFQLEFMFLFLSLLIIKCLLIIEFENSVKSFMN